MTKEEPAAWWAWFAETECRGSSTLYERICLRVAATDSLIERLLTLPAHAQQPNMLLAAAHDLVVRRLPVGRVSPNRAAVPSVTSSN